MAPEPLNTTEESAIATAEKQPPDKGAGLTLLQQLRAFGWQGAVLTAVLIGLYYPVLWRLVRQWYEDGDYSHGFLVPILSAYLIWQRRDKLA